MCVNDHMLANGYERQCDKKYTVLHVWHRAVLLSRGSKRREHSLELYIWDKIILEGIVSIRQMNDQGF